MLRCLAMCAALVLPTLANATTGLVWQWEQDQVRRYAITAEVSMPEVLLFRAQNNYDVRVPQFSVELNLACKAVVPAGKNAWELACTYDDVALHAKPVRIDRGQLQAVLDEMDQNFKVAVAQVILDNDGRVKSLSLENLEGRNQRYREVEEIMRLVTQRALAGLDLHLPKNGDDGGKVWGQKVSLAMAYAKSTGSSGRIALTSLVQSMDGDKAEIATTGRALVQTEIVSRGTPVEMRHELEMRSLAVFDTAAGEMVKRDYLVEGEPTADSVGAEGVGGLPYVQALTLKLIPEGKNIPKFGPNSEMGAEKPVETIE
jgi:hypothetical protein